MERAFDFRWRQRLPEDGLRARLAMGAVCVRYDYVASLLFVTVRWQSRVHLVQTELGTYLRAAPYILFTLLFGWWGVPWGPIDSARALWNNLGGGLDVTGDVLAELEAA